MGIHLGLNFSNDLKLRNNHNGFRGGLSKSSTVLPNDIFVKSLINDKVSFAGLKKLDQYEQLLKKDKENVLKVAKAFLDDSNCPLTLIGEKAGSLVVVSKEDAETLRKHIELFNSDKFKVIVESLEATQNKQLCNVYVVNIDDQTKMITRDLDYLKHRLNDKCLTPEKALDKLFADGSPLFDLNNNHDLVGMVIGFPTADSLIFKLSRDIKQQMRFLNKSAQGDTNGARFLQLLDAMASQVKHPAVQAVMDKFGIKNPESPLRNTGGAYIFETWDKDRPEVKDIIDKVPEAIKNAKQVLKQPEDVLKLMLDV